ncbi:DUF6069 family protein [Agromyces bauzanensis]
MDTSTIDSTIDTTPRRSQGRSLFREAVVGAVAAAAVNAAIWGVGRAAGVSFHVRPESGSEVGILLIVPTTLILIAAGIGLFALAARRSRRMATAVLVAGVVFAAGSTAAAIWAAEDAATAALLVTMHLVTGAAFAIIAGRALRAPGRGIRSVR